MFAKLTSFCSITQHLHEISKLSFPFVHAPNLTLIEDIGHVVCVKQNSCWGDVVVMHFTLPVHVLCLQSAQVIVWGGCESTIDGHSESYEIYC